MTREFGPGWVAFRAAYALRQRLGLLRWRMPAWKWEDRPLATWLLPGVPSEAEAYFAWREGNAPDFLWEEPLRLPAFPAWNIQTVLQEAEAALNGQLRYFSNQQVEIGFPPDWSLDPSTGLRLSLDAHWTKLSGHGPHDIKYVWEPARFAWAYILARAYIASGDERYPQAFWTVLEDWLQRNPPNHGPGWMDGQECALRITAACFALAAFRRSPAVTPERISRFTLFAAASAERIRANLAYAVSTRSNHTVSEAFGLWLTGTFFSELKKAAGWKALGRKMLIEESQRQLFDDGGYAMYSLNYQRFTLQIYCLVLRLGEMAGDPFPREIYDKLSAAADFFTQLIQPETGEMPEFGSNDGALVLPLNTCSFNDYRPLLQLCRYTAHRSRFLPPGPWDEDLFWLFGPQPLALPNLPFPTQEPRAFLDAGIYTLRTAQALAVLRCPEHRARPSHADGLHLDLWLHGEHVAVDAGTFSYHAPPPWRNGLASVSSHNTVCVDGREPMTRLGPFTWGDWSQGHALRREPGLLIAQVDGYRRLSDPVTQRRLVQALPGERWLVVDALAGRRAHTFRLHWLLADFPFSELEDGPGLVLSLTPGPLFARLGALEGPGSFSLVRASESSARGWRSRTYGQREPALSLALEYRAPVVHFWTLFGGPGDRVAAQGSRLSVLANGREPVATIDLTEIL